LTITLILEGISLYLVLRGNLYMAKIVVPLALIAAITIISLDLNGLKSDALLGLPIVLVVSAILLGQSFLVLIVPIALFAVILIAIVDLSGRIPFTPSSLGDAIIVPVLLIGSAAAIELMSGRLAESVRRARESEGLYREENVELNELRAVLEERVRQRTEELDAANRSNQRRARQFEAIAQANRAIASVQDLDTLLPRIAQVISERFNFYHTGIFLIDKERRFAVLRAASSEGGRKMLERGHKLEIGQSSIVGFVAATNQPRIALDVGGDPVHFENPDLPQTHSEIALPLQYEGRILGVLDVQSDEPEAFGQDDVEVLSTLAAQVSIAIQNALTLENAQKALSESRLAFEQSVHEAWRLMRPKAARTGFRFNEAGLAPLEENLDGDHIREAISKGQAVLAREKDEAKKLAVPIRLRGQVVGALHVQARNRRSLTSDDLDIAQAIMERLSLAIETATLIQSTQHRADIERLTAQISSRIGSSTRFETILQTAAEELSKALGGSDVLVQIEPLSVEMEIEG
ncbi:MAG: GAF domain-containing protein, partial [Chloroflexi bacterium]|nr:GAF domain-containing protein [Chloroflexota bacterium]